MSGNPGGRPNKKPITEELERLLAEEAPNGNGQTWVTVVTQALLHEASKGNTKAISELANRVEGRPPQSMALNFEADEGLAAALERAFWRAIEGMTAEQIQEKIRRLQDQLAITKQTEQIGS